MIGVKELRGWEKAQAIRAEILKVVTGQDQVVDEVMVAFLAAGHVIIEGLPGLGKTLLVRALAKTFGGRSCRIQFTPDLMPSDIMGHSVYNMQTGEFTLRRGPVFTQLLIADEINRAPAKTQAAVLEVMQEHQVTIDGTTHPLAAPFMAMATQNPFEHEGTYPLPDAQLDRFLLKIRIGYPEAEEELRMVEQQLLQGGGEKLSVEAVSQITTVEEVIELQRAVASVHVDREVMEYAVRIVRTTRGWPGISAGAGPRGSLALVRAAKAVSFLNARDFVLPDDVKRVAVPVLRHRLALAPEVELEGQNAEQILSAILGSVQAPRR